MERAANKSERLLQLEALLLTHPDGLHRAEIARRLGVHRSTVGRDIDGLSQRVPIWEDGNLIGINRDDYRVDVRLTLHEAMALHLAARLLATRTDKHNPHAAAALRKLGLSLEKLAPLVSAHLQLSAEVMESAAQRHDPVYLEVLETLTRAWSLGRKVRLWHQMNGDRVFEYRFAPYFIEPYAVGRTTHVIGWREPPGALRTFKLERIRRIELLDEAYQVPADFDPREQLAEAWGIWYSEEPPADVVLRFHPRVAGRVRETQWHRSERVEEGADGSLIWQAQVAEPREMLPWVRGWGADVEVLEPEALRRELMEGARELARVYRITPIEDVGRQYYAHSKAELDESEWQPLKDHLLATGALAFELGRDAGVSELAQAAGILHDIGKYSQAFQDRLRGAKRRVDHATAGAREVVRLFPGNPYAELLSYCIAGHHTGLPDYGDSTDLRDGPSLVSRREKKQLGDYSAYRTEIDPSTLNLQPVQIKPSPSHPGFTVSFLARMIFSTLVDADWLETETYMQDGPRRRGGHDTLGTLLQRFSSYIKRFDNLQGAVNEKRSETLRACVSKAGLEPGFFTLTVPTGGGKTLASLAFALNHAVKHDLKRIIYVIPFTSIIEQNAGVFKDALGLDNVLEHHSNFDWEQLNRHDVPTAMDDETNRLGEKLKLSSENWDIPIVVTTNVQFFESLFASKKTRARKVHNVAKSVLIFDEAQMLPREHMKPCMLAVWELVKNYGATAIFCTATQPDLIPYLPGEAMVELAPDPQALFDFYRSAQIRPTGELSDVDLAARLNSHCQVLCVVNTRRHAKGLFYLLEPEGRFHLSTLMCPVHRQQVLADVRRCLAENEICRVVSTQVIEAGVDLDFPVGFRALAGLDSIIQAAGRVNRERRNASGDMYVFEPHTDLIKRIPAFIAQTAQAGASVLREFSHNPTSPQAIQAYFQLLDTLQNPQRNADVRKMLEYLDKEHFDFAKAGENFRLIESATIPVIIPFDDRAQESLAKMRYSVFPSGLARRLQRYTVSIYEQEFEALLAKGAIDTYHDVYFVLNDMTYYCDQTGLELLSDQGGEAIFFD